MDNNLAISRNKLLLAVAIFALIVFCAALFFFEKENEVNVVPLPSAQRYESIADSLEEKQPAEDQTLPAEVNLAVPFASQAPHQNWDLPYQEFCEEASILMAASYVKGKNISGADDADAKMLAIKDFQEERFGYYKDTTAEETATVLREFYGIPDVEVVYNPTDQQIKSAVAKGKVVLVPAAGRELGNPNFRQPGPLYHMLVIKGYTTGGDFITNDPGTRKGADYVYRPDVVLNAIHDWNGGDVYNGRKVAITVG